MRMSDAFPLLTVGLVFWLHESFVRCLMDFRVVGFSVKFWAKVGF